ncbi:MAG: lytic transglycosylase domain-containing protein [Ginsengibacter sp.]
MRVHPIKFLYSLVIISGVCIKKLSAQIINADTVKILAAVSKKTIDYRSSVIASNVVFPESLEGSREQALDYVEKFSDKKRNYLLRIYETGKKYFPKISVVLRQYKLPEELKVLIALESGFSANAVSKAGAVGYWQLMDVAAKEYGLQIANKDERKNFSKSTLAAVKYLRDRKLNLNNDLLLMVASYNCGVGTIKNAIRKCHKTDPGFWDIKNLLPAETRNYVMNFIALNVIFNNYENFVKEQLLFKSKEVYKIPFQIFKYNNTLPSENLKID